MKSLFSRTGTLVVCLLVFSTLNCFAQSSAQELMDRVFKALETNDRQTLTTLLISEAEIKAYVWPNLPAIVRNGTNEKQFITTYVKGSEGGLAEALAKYGGHKWTVVKTATEEKKKGANYRLLTPPLITIRDEKGMESNVRIVGDLLETNGVVRVTTYYASPALK